MATAGALVDRAARNLNDPSNTHWSEVELLEYLSDAQRLAVQVRPQVNPVTVDMNCVNGALQTIPDDGFVLLDVFHNVFQPYTVSGSVFTATAGEDVILDAISKTARASLDQQEVGWYGETVEMDGSNGGVENFVYEPDIRRQFWLYPHFNLPALPSSVPSGWPKVKITYSKVPAEITADTTNVEIGEAYHPALLAFMMYRANMKDVAGGNVSQGKAMGYLEQFMTYLLGRRNTNITLFPTAEMEKVID